MPRIWRATRFARARTGAVLIVACAGVLPAALLRDASPSIQASRELGLIDVWLNQVKKQKKAGADAWYWSPIQVRR